MIKKKLMKKFKFIELTVNQVHRIYKISKTEWRKINK